MKVFWPRHAPRTGTAYGWRNGDIAVVAAVVESGRDDQDTLADTPSLSKLVQQAGSLPCMIATCDASRIPWLVLEDGVESVDIVLYDQPQRHKLHFLSLDPVSLHRANELPDPRVSKLAPLDMESPSPSLSRTVDQINCADEFAALFARGSARAREAIGNRILDWMFTRTQRSLPAIVRWLQGRVVPPIARFSSISATASQLHLRALQVVYASDEMQRAQKHQGVNSWAACGPYVSFWNCVWLLLNDCILGYTVGSFLIENHVFVGAAINAGVQWTAHSCVAESLAWLDSWPVGLKLNTELSSSFHLAFLAITRIFASGVDFVAPFFPGVVFLFGAVGSCSLSLLLALFTDLLTLISLNITLSYLAAAAILRFQLHAASALFTLFRGKRKNILRGRVDNWEYDIDQLILGTVLFTLVAFLMPTVLVYYVFFASLRLGVLFTYAAIEVLLACVNYFPLFALMLRIKDPARLPGGICFVPAPTRENPEACRLHNQPLATSAILSHFGRYFSSMARHYHPGRIIWRFVSGGHLDPMPSSTHHLFR